MRNDAYLCVRDDSMPIAKVMSSYVAVWAGKMSVSVLLRWDSLQVDGHRNGLSWLPNSSAPGTVIQHWSLLLPSDAPLYHDEGE